jgi:TRAP-type C4-dicarboxylate transport system permease large subunit
MSTFVVTILVLTVFLVFAIMGTPLAYSLLLAGTLGLILIDGFSGAAFELGTAPYGTAASYFLLLIPIYVLIGMLVTNGGLAEKVYRVASYVFRRIPGGVGIATVVACAGFAAVTGSSIATVATIGRIAVKEMREFGIKGSTAAGLVAAAGTLGALIPPSVVLVLYGFISGESIGRLLLAGIIPGILTALVYSVYLMIAERGHAGKGVKVRKREAALVGSNGEPVEQYSELQARLDAVSGKSASGSSVPTANGASTTSAEGRVPWEAALYILLIFGVVVGGMYSGFFTVVESGAVGVILALAIIIIEAKRNKQSLSQLLKDSLAESMSVMSMVFGLLLGGGVLAMYFVSTRLPYDISNWATGLDIPPIALIILMLLILIPLGMFLEPMSIILILVPIYHPIVTELGYDGIWFAILFVRLIEVAMITPPVGLNVFVIAGVARDVPVEQVFKGVMPFVLLDLVTVGIMIAIPEIVTFLPDMAGI